MGPESVLNSLSNLQDGLAESGFYPDFPAAIRTAIGNNKEALAAALANYAAGEMWLRAQRAALDLETNNGRNSLRTAASTCESLDRRDESLVGVGWELRRPPGRPRPVVAPARFTVKNTGYEGEVEARWTRVSNAHFQEAKVFTSPTIDNPDMIPWDTLPVIPVRQASLLIKDQPVGAWLTARVRPRPRRRCQRPQLVDRCRHRAHQLTAPRLPGKIPNRAPALRFPPVGGVFSFRESFNSLKYFRQE